MSAELAVKKSLIEQAYDLAAPVVDPSTTKEELEALRLGRRMLFGIEQAAAEKMDEKIKKLTIELHRSGYPEAVMPLEPLGWRWPNGMPQLALLSLESPFLTLGAEVEFSGNDRHIIGDGRMPSLLRDMYRDVAERAAGRCIRNGSRRTFTFTFDGVIPSETRTKIQEAMHSARFQYLFLLAESPAEAWKLATRKGMSRREQMREVMSHIDPLVLGWAHETLFVIDKFDLTTLEQYVLDEFSSRALMPGPALD